MIGKALRLPAAAATRWLSERLTRRHRGEGIVEGTLWPFDPFAYAEAGKCTLVARDIEHVQLLSAWDGRATIERPANGAFTVGWNGMSLSLYILTADENRPAYFALVAAQRADALRFFEEVCRWQTEPNEAILVFHAGQWVKDEKLFASIRDATFDNLVMPADVKAEIAGDATRFFASRERYARYKVPWKRGVLFVGPPGNGKTHAVKAIVNHATVRCLYVRSFDLPGHPFPGAGIAMAFERARAVAPCILVLEDLDSLVREDNRAYFLNELDGFERNDGMLVLATTNHPERIDASIVDRPSRFDRKYGFPLPSEEQRRAYVAMWNADLDPDLVLDEQAAEDVVARTADFSYAYLKELFVSSLMRWVGDEAARFGAVLAEQADVLRNQMVSAPDGDASPPTGPGAFGWSYGMPGWSAQSQAMIRMMSGMGL